MSIQEEGAEGPPKKPAASAAIETERRVDGWRGGGTGHLGGGEPPPPHLSLTGCGQASEGRRRSADLPLPILCGSVRPLREKTGSGVSDLAPRALQRPPALFSAALLR